MRLMDAYCPECGEKLSQTNCLNGTPPKGCKLLEISTPDTEAIARARFEIYHGGAP
jgi:hypothetical protein